MHFKIENHLLSYIIKVKYLYYPKLPALLISLFKIYSKKRIELQTLTQF